HLLSRCARRCLRMRRTSSSGVFSALRVFGDAAKNCYPSQLADNRLLMNSAICAAFSGELSIRSASKRLIRSRLLQAFWRRQQFSRNDPSNRGTVVNLIPSASSSCTSATTSESNINAPHEKATAKEVKQNVWARSRVLRIYP